MPAMVTSSVLIMHVLIKIQMGSILMELVSDQSEFTFANVGHHHDYVLIKILSHPGKQGVSTES